MKSLLLAAGLLVVGVTTASAQYAAPPWSRGAYPYEQRYHTSCQEKAFRVHQFERRAGSDGVLTWRERATLRKLRWDLDRSCGRFRHRG